MSNKSTEIIDLTTSDDPDVVILDSDGSLDSRAREFKDPTRSHASTQNRHEEGAREVIVVEEGAEKQPVTPLKKSKKARKKRKRALENVEDGEIVEDETANNSVQVSREVSTEGIVGEEQEMLNANPIPTTTTKKKKKKNSGVESRGLLARLSDRPKDVAQELDVNSLENKSHDASGHITGVSDTGSKRKRREKARERQLNKSDALQPPSIDDPPPFFIDDQPADIPNPVAAPALPPRFLAPTDIVDETHSDPATTKLLLPAHVSVLQNNGDNPIVEITAPVAVDSEDEDYIDYVDYDGDQVKGTIRYFDSIDDDATPKTVRTTRIVCKKCGAENEHKTQECPVLVCLTCGARDEHGTRSCPISKTCFTCGLKGHINRDCPNRYSHQLRQDVYADCGRCGSMNHKMSQCPTLWRIYEYVSDAERKIVLEEREQKSSLEVGAGGEGYIGPEDWCYNCGSCGHLGDVSHLLKDCEELTFPFDHPREPSAFSEHNTRSGPFSDAARESRPHSKAALHAKNADEAWGDGHGAQLPLDVGRQGKQKERARMQKRAQELQEDEGDDWFASRAGDSSTANGRDAKHSGRTPKGPRDGRSNGKTISFGNLGKSEDRYGRDHRERDKDRRDGRDRRDRGDDRDWRTRDDRRSDRSYRNDLPEPSRETDSIRVRGASRKGGDGWGVSIRGAASRHDDDHAESRNDLYERQRYERSRDNRDTYDRKRDWRETSPKREPRYRGGYSR
ncbi:hypothetical protein BC835DRAFT_1309489 [Cytidiella melzeri]|nr:hypothetical protein BC835DRAFT_1309489 [Cytidiella melzeri]